MISIIIPYYNHAGAIENTLASIKGQTYTDVEVIIVDDGSNVPLEQSQLEKMLPTIQLSTHSENKGAPAARNTGLVQATGEYVIFWDADVVAQPDMLEKMAQLLDTEPGVGFVYSNFVFGPKTFTLQPFSVSALKEQNYIHSTSLLRRDIAIEWDESLTKLQDWDYWLTLAGAGHIGYWIDAVLFTVGQRKEGMSRWIPSFAYQKPFRWLPPFKKHVQKYERAKHIVEEKHGLV